MLSTFFFAGFIFLIWEGNLFFSLIKIEILDATFDVLQSLLTQLMRIVDRDVRWNCSSVAYCWISYLLILLKTTHNFHDFSSLSLHSPIHLHSHFCCLFLLLHFTVSFAELMHFLFLYFRFFITYFPFLIKNLVCFLLFRLYTTKIYTNILSIEDEGSETLYLKIKNTEKKMVKR